MEIRAATAGDFDAMWAIFRAAIATEDALPFAGTFEASTFQGHWFGLQPAYVALLQDHVVGMYRMGANFPDLGAHVASATYVVDPTVQGRGIGRALVEHSLDRARGRKASWPCSSITWSAPMRQRSSCTGGWGLPWLERYRRHSGIERWGWWTCL